MKDTLYEYLEAQYYLNMFCLLIDVDYMAENKLELFCEPD